jgi:hypothetical protein
MPDLAPVAHGYNKPDRADDVEASFLDLGTAQSYADAYGGTIEARGVAFVVRDADHDKALSDLAEAQKVVPNAAVPVASDIDAAVERALARQRDQLRAEFEAEAAAQVTDASGSGEPESAS